jgi:hypothetical protein
MRFKTGQQSYGTIVAKVKIMGRGGTTGTIDHPIALRVQGGRQQPVRFTESKALASMKPS